MGDDRQSNTDVEVSPERNQVPPRQDEATVDDFHRLLASARRRLLLSFLADREADTASTDELVDAVAGRERPDPGPATHRDRIRTELHHVHLLKLADAGVIDYDPVAGTVRYDGPEELETILESSNEVG